MFSRYTNSQNWSVDRYYLHNNLNLNVVYKWKTNDLENWKLLTEETSEDVSRSFKIPGNELKLKVFVDIIQNMCGRNGKILM